MKKLMKSFLYAGKGVRVGLAERNMRIHLVAAVIVVVMAVVLKVRPDDWVILVLIIAMVLVAELFNTAIEHMVDRLSPGHSDAAGKVKDLAAGAVLITAIGAAVAGVLIFWPYLPI